MFYDDLKCSGIYGVWSDVPEDEKANLVLSFVEDQDYGNEEWIAESFSGEGCASVADAKQQTDVFNKLALKLISSTLQKLQNYDKTDGPVVIPSSLAQDLVEFSKKGLDLCNDHIGAHIEDNYFYDARIESCNEYDNAMKNYYSYED